MLALDTEDNSQGQVAIINFYDGERHHTFTGPHLRQRAWAYLETVGPQHIWACNMEYDLINVFGSWLGKMCTIQYVSAGMLRATACDWPIVFYETMRHWPASVKQMGDALGLPKKRKNFTSIKYCHRDTEIVYRFVSAMLERYEKLHLPLKSTLPSTALCYLERFTDIPRFPFPADVLAWLRQGYFGGRVEVYRLGRIRGPIYHYDVNSLFPSVMRDCEYPMLKEYAFTTTPNFEHEGMFEGMIRLPETIYPCLPFRTTDDLIYPYGMIHGTWTYPEVRQALKDGAEIVKVTKCVEFEERCRPFQAFVNQCYNQRLLASNKIDDTFWKLMMNACYGKFAQWAGLEMVYQDREFTLETPASHVNVIWSAYVTAYARLRLLKLMRDCGTVYYTDTDSIFTDHALPTSKELGELKLEGVYKTVEFLGNKIYRTGSSYKAKGVPRHMAKDFIRTGRAVYRRPARFRESRHSFLRPNYWYEVEKSLLKEYSKRIILSDGSTKPWNLSDYLNLIGT